MARKPLSTRIESWLQKEIKKLAIDLERPVNDLLEEAIRDVLRKYIGKVPEKTERRLYPRVPVKWSATIKTSNAEFEGKVENISPDGVVFVSQPGNLPEKGKLGIVIQPPGRQPIRAIVRVIWTSKFTKDDSELCFSMGLQFEEISRGDSQLLHDLLA
jgi:hypothetical protein